MNHRLKPANITLNNFSNRFRETTSLYPCCKYKKTCYNRIFFIYVKIRKRDLFLSSIWKSRVNKVRTYHNTAATLSNRLNTTYQHMYDLVCLQKWRKIFEFQQTKCANAYQGCQMWQNSAILISGEFYPFQRSRRFKKGAKFEKAEFLG